MGCYKGVHPSRIPIDNGMQTLPVMQALFEAITEENPSMNMGLMHLWTQYLGMMLSYFAIALLRWDTTLSINPKYQHHNIRYCKWLSIANAARMVTSCSVQYQSTVVFCRVRTLMSVCTMRTLRLHRSKQTHPFRSIRYEWQHMGVVLE